MIPTEIHFDLPISFSSLRFRFPRPLPAPLQRKPVTFLLGGCSGARRLLLVENQEILTEQGELQLTDYGVSGIPVFQISRFAVRACMQKNALGYKRSFFPELTESGLQNLSDGRKSARIKRQKSF